eukprot:2658646-Pleurochrysis_carterae.AAC.1
MTFSRSFVVGGLNDVCAAAYALACGLSESTFYNARANLRLNRSYHSGRVNIRDKLESEERIHLEAHI